MEELWSEEHNEGRSRKNSGRKSPERSLKPRNKFEILVMDHLNVDKSYQEDKRKSSWDAIRDLGQPTPLIG